MLCLCMDKIQHIFILVPSAVMDSPIKGAIALANALVGTLPVTLVTLKEGKESLHLMDERVNFISLSSLSSWYLRLKEYQKLLQSCGGREHVGSISSCFSADLINSFCGKNAVTCSSVRGNLIEVYPYTFGKFGSILAYIHLKLGKRFDHVVSMTDDMSRQVESFISKPSPIIGNFIDEQPLEHFRNKVAKTGDYRFVFSGSLSELKQPSIMIEAIGRLYKNGINVRLDILGDGPLRESLEQQVKSLLIDDSVIFHGFVKEPYAIVAKADVLILPSLTEGISRAALEALFLGVPCIMRNVDGNSDLIQEGFNGVLFTNDGELASKMLIVAQWSREHNCYEKNLLPVEYSQQAAAGKFLKLINNTKI